MEAGGHEVAFPGRWVGENWIGLFVARTRYFLNRIPYLRLRHAVGLWARSATGSREAFKWQVPVFITAQVCLPYMRLGD